jgi:multiple sugar transport system permease protein
LAVAAPGLISTFIFAFTICWCEYLYALVIISDSYQKTIPLGLSEWVVDDLFEWGSLMGGAIFAAVPVVIVYFFASRYLVSGMTLGSLKQ